MTLRARTVFADDRLKVAVIESLELNSVRRCGGALVTGSLKPIAVIVRQPGRAYALDMDAQPLDLEQLDLRLDGVGPPTAVPGN